MFRKSLVPSVLFLSIAALSAMASTVQAQEADVNFSGSVTKACQFIGDPVNGSLAPNNETLPTQLSSKGAGTPGNIKVRCNSAATISAGIPVSTGDKFDFAAVEHSLTANGKTDVILPAEVGTLNNVNVNLTLNNKGAVIPPGNYAYKIVVSAVAN
jgi:hypothetical protein